MGVKYILLIKDFFASFFIWVMCMRFFCLKFEHDYVYINCNVVYDFNNSKELNYLREPCKYATLSLIYSPGKTIISDDFDFLIRKIENLKYLE